MTGSADYLNLTRESFPLERYEPLELLGRGGLGEVYFARDRQLSRNVAVKCLMAVDEETIVIFHREAKIASKLHHPNIVGTLDFGTTNGGRPYIAFEYFKGISLEQLIAASERRIDEVMVRKIFIAVARALSYIHEHNVFHRDMKPSNIMLNLDDPDSMQLRVIDFGVSSIKEDIQNRSLSQGKTIVGTPVYMSPDPVRGDEFDSRSEVYSLGCIMFECLVGEPPFDAPSTAEVLNLHVTATPPLLAEIAPDLEVSRELEQIIYKCLNKDKDRRYQTMLELVDALESPYSIQKVEYGLQQSNDLQSESPANKRFSVAIVSGAVVLTISVLIAVFTIITDPSSTTDVLKTSESMKELTQDRRAAFKPLDAELGAIKDDSANGAYISGTAGLARLKKLAQSRQRRTMVTLKSLEFDSSLLRDLAVVQPRTVQIFDMDISDKSAFEKMDLVASIRELDFHACSNIEPDDLAALSDMPRLSSLLLVGCLITDEHLKALKGNKRLEKLVLDGNKDLSINGLLNLSRKPEEPPIAVWLNEGDLTKLSSEEIQDLRKKHRIVLTTRLPEYQGEGGDGMIHTDALELIE
jgi:serine/threonine-protein kinase